jgi:hypothetical protein
MTSVVITGATGTIGRAACRALLARGVRVTALARDGDRARAALGDHVDVRVWSDPQSAPPPADALAGADGIVHLLGEPIDQRWSEEAKARIRNSRVQSTRGLVSSLRQLPETDRPGVLVSQSATGYYGSRGDEELDEGAPPGSDFLAGVVTEWEAEARAAEDLMRVVETRTGVVLSRSGGALARMLPFFRAGIGGPVAGGRQYVSWIHLSDVVSGLLFCLDRTGATGPVNLTAPSPVTNAELSRALGRALSRPALLPVPGLALRLLYGEMAEIVTGGQRVIPGRLLELGFEFSQPEIGPALGEALRSTRG